MLHDQIFTYNWSVELRCRTEACNSTSTLYGDVQRADDFTQCFLNLGNYEAALSVFQDILQHNEHNKEFQDKVRFQIACCLLKLRKYADSLALFQKLVSNELDNVFQADQYQYADQTLVGKWICLHHLGLENDELQTTYFVLLMVLKQSGTNWPHKLYVWFKTLDEYFVDLAFPFYGAMFSLEIEDRNERTDEEIETEMCQTWDLTCTSFYITDFFRKCTLKAKNEAKNSSLAKVCKNKN